MGNSARKVLIVDDSRFARLSLKRLISQMRPDWEVFEAESVDQALEVTRDIQPDFFSVDLNMPERDGFELVEALRADDPAARIVLVTANIQTATEDRAKDLAVPCVNKPVTEESVQELIEGLLG